MKATQTQWWTNNLFHKPMIEGFTINRNKEKDQNFELARKSNKDGCYEVGTNLSRSRGEITIRDYIMRIWIEI
jgi:hypothetical protein